MTPLIASLGVVVAGMFTFLGARWGRKGERENVLIDQLQEEQIKSRERMDRLEAEINQLRSQLITWQSRDVQWAWHAERIEQQLIDKGEIPHPRPLALRLPEIVSGD